MVFDAPAASADQLDLAVMAARRSFPGWAARGISDRAALVIATAEAGVAEVTDGGLAHLLTREHGKA